MATVAEIQSEMEDLVREVPSIPSQEMVLSTMESVKERIVELQTEDLNFAECLRLEVSRKAHQAVVDAIGDGGRPIGTAPEVTHQQLVALAGKSKQVLVEIDQLMEQRPEPDPERRAKIQMLKIGLKQLARRHNELAEA